MHIIVVSQNFYPEEFKVNDLVKELVIKGHCVTVLSDSGTINEESSILNF